MVPPLRDGRGEPRPVGNAGRPARARFLRRAFCDGLRATMRGVGGMGAFRACLAGILGLLLLAISAGADDITELTLPTKELVYDSLRQKIYASLPGTLPGIGNSITTIDPLRRAI